MEYTNNLREEYNREGYVIVEDFLPTDVYNEMIDIFYKGEYVEIAQSFDDRYELWQNKGGDMHAIPDKCFPSTDEVYTNHFWGSAEVSHNLKVLNVYKENIKSFIEFILDEQVGKGRHQATKYNKNGKDFLRVHVDDYMGYIGYVMHFQKETWKYDWGGLLQMSIGIASHEHRERSKDIKTLLPQPNRLIVHNHSMGIPHWVTPVNSWSKENRYTLTGFCIRSDDEVPETWRSRNDYSIL